MPTAPNKERDSWGHRRASEQCPETERNGTTNGAHGSSRGGTLASVSDSETSVVELLVVATRVLRGAAREFIRGECGYFNSVSLGELR